ncbi:hypothetical protein, partial [Lactiplantibacillus plantarum]|uniref:hypothetical protein n=1 Tax=Lactiplantibacillus plantarum TaxID=1590 RepID=UPI000DBBEAF2
PNIYIIDIGGYFNNDFEGLFGENGPLKIYSLLDLPIFLEDLFCSNIEQIIFKKVESETAYSFDSLFVVGAYGC